MFVFRDMMQREVILKSKPQRIISVVPSQTELLYDLGLDSEVVGITKFCIHPDKWFKKKARIGGTKKLNIEKISALNPDLIIANKEENTQSDIELLAKQFPVWISDIKTLADSLVMISEIGKIVGKSHMAKPIIDMIDEGFKKLETGIGKRKALYLIWRNPWMSINEDTFIHDMLSRIGLDNVTRKYSNRYPALHADEIKQLDPDLVLLSSEPFPFKDMHIAELQEIVPNARIGLVDGEAFSWYGSRLVQSPPYFEQLQKKWEV